jgi:hypothetical protein
MPEIRVEFQGKVVVMQEYKVLFPDRVCPISYYRLVSGEVKDLPPGLFDRQRIVEVGGNAKPRRGKARL